MSASFPPMMFSMEELVGVVKLIIQMESAMAQDDNMNNRHRNGHHHRSKHHKHHKRQNHEPPNIQRWISRRSKRDILFLLASISGVKMKIYSLPSSIKGHTKNDNHKNNKKQKVKVCKERVCRVSMDGKYLSFGADGINLDKRLEISLGVDLCYNNVRIILKQMGLYDYYTHSTYDSTSCSSTSTSTSSSSISTYHSSSSSASTIADDIISNARFAHKITGNDRLKTKHCITIHDPATMRTLILQLNNCSDRTMWAKGLCHLKHLNQKARNFRWTVVAYLISKYASTLNAHSQSNLNNNKGLKGVSKGLNALKMGLTSSKPKVNKQSHHPMNTPCYFEPFVQLIKVIGAQNNNGLHPKYPRRYNEMYKRRLHRLKHNKSNYEQFGENDLMYDPNKAMPKPGDNDVYYE